MSVDEMMAFRGFINQTLDLAQTEGMRMDRERVEAALETLQNIPSRREQIESEMSEHTKTLSNLEEIMKRDPEITEEILTALRARITTFQNQLQALEGEEAEPRNIISEELESLFEQFHARFANEETPEAAAYRELFKKLHEIDPDIPREIPQTPEMYQAAIREEFFPKETQERLDKEAMLLKETGDRMQKIRNLSPQTTTIEQEDYDGYISKGDRIKRSSERYIQNRGSVTREMETFLKTRRHFNTRELAAIQANREIVDAIIEDEELENLREAYEQIHAFKENLRRVTHVDYSPSGEVVQHPFGKDILEKILPTHPLAKTLLRAWLFHALPLEGLDNDIWKTSLEPYSPFRQFNNYPGAQQINDFVRNAPIFLRELLEGDVEDPQIREKLLNIRAAVNSIQAQFPTPRTFEFERREAKKEDETSIPALRRNLPKEGWSITSRGQTSDSVFVSPDGDAEKAVEFYVRVHDRIEQRAKSLDPSLEESEPTTIRSLRERQEKGKEKIRKTIDELLVERRGLEDQVANLTQEFETLQSVHQKTLGELERSQRETQAMRGENETLERSFQSLASELGILQKKLGVEGHLAVLENMIEEIERLQWATGQYESLHRRATEAMRHTETEDIPGGILNSGTNLRIARERLEKIRNLLTGE